MATKKLTISVMNAIKVLSKVEEANQVSAWSKVGGLCRVGRDQGLRRVGGRVPRRDWTLPTQLCGARAARGPYAPSAPSAPRPAAATRAPLTPRVPRPSLRWGASCRRTASTTR
jgi:hypothetical protein